MSYPYDDDPFSDDPTDEMAKFEKVLADQKAENERLREELDALKAGQTIEPDPTPEWTPPAHSDVEVQAEEILRTSKSREEFQQRMAELQARSHRPAPEPEAPAWQSMSYDELAKAVDEAYELPEGPERDARLRELGAAGSRGAGGIGLGGGRVEFIR